MTKMTKKQKNCLEKYQKIEDKDALISITNFSDEIVYEEPSPTNPYARMRIYEIIIDEIDDFFTEDLSWSSEVKVSKDMISIRRI